MEEGTQLSNGVSGSRSSIPGMCTACCHKGTASGATPAVHNDREGAPHTHDQHRRARQMPGRGSPA